jgi:hypothetical protein
MECTLIVLEVGVGDGAGWLTDTKQKIAKQTFCHHKFTFKSREGMPKEQGL